LTIPDVVLPGRSRDTLFGNTIRTVKRLVTPTGLNDDHH